MKIQKVIRAQGDYAKKKVDINDGDLITILDGGQTVTGDYGDRLVFKVETKNGEKNLTFNQKSLNNLVDVFGDDSSAWIGKKVKVWLIRAMVSGKLQDICYLSNPDWMMAEDGSFHAPNSNISSKKEIKDEDIPIINQDDEPEVNLNDIPF